MTSRPYKTSGATPENSTPFLRPSTNTFPGKRDDRKEGPRVSHADGDRVGGRISKGDRDEDES